MKSVILSAGLDGDYEGMINDHKDRMLAYCDKWHCDYHYVTVKDLKPGWTGWYRMHMTQEAIASGLYDYVFWIDCDAFIVDFNVDLRSALPYWAWLGMRIHPNSWCNELWHWQSGVFYVRACTESLAYFTRVLDFAKPGAGDDQTYMMDLLLDEDQWQSGFVTLRQKWNHTPHTENEPNPVVMAFHGVCDRRNLVKQMAERYPY